MNAVTYRHIRHAAHYAYQHPAGGHDLEQWDAEGPNHQMARRLAGSQIPKDAEYHSGYLKDGVQHYLFVRTAPLSTGTCARCAGLQGKA